jgi:hypothetical protein
MNKKFEAPAPSCYVYKQVNANPIKTTLPANKVLGKFSGLDLNA